MKYKLIQAGDPITFEATVNKSIKEGWQPVGGVAYGYPQINVDSKNKHTNVLFQAMIKHN